MGLASEVVKTLGNACSTRSTLNRMILAMLEGIPCRDEGLKTRTFMSCYPSLFDSISWSSQEPGAGAPPCAATVINSAQGSSMPLSSYYSTAMYKHVSTSCLKNPLDNTAMSLFGALYTGLRLLVLTSNLQLERRPQIHIQAGVLRTTHQLVLFRQHIVG